MQEELICKSCWADILEEDYDGEFLLCPACKERVEKTFKQLLRIFFTRDEVYWLDRVYDGRDIGEGVDFKEVRECKRC